MVRVAMVRDTDGANAKAPKMESKADDATEIKANRESNAANMESKAANTQMAVTKTVDGLKATKQ